MAILTAIDSILALPVVRWLLLAATVASITTATWCKLQIGTVRLQRDAAQGQAATYKAHLELQNESILKAGKETKLQHEKMDAANAKAAAMKRDLEAWRKKVNQVELVGTCDQMVDKVIAAVKE